MQLLLGGGGGENLVLATISGATGRLSIFAVVDVAAKPPLFLCSDREITLIEAYLVVKCSSEEGGPSLLLLVTEPIRIFLPDRRDLYDQAVRRGTSP